MDNRAPTLHVVSFDFDGFFADNNGKGSYAEKVAELKDLKTKDPKAYYQALAKHVAEHPSHKAFFEALFEDKTQEYVMMVGSNRQDGATDYDNGVSPRKGECGTCFPVFEELETSLRDTFGIGISLDRTLYSDHLAGRDQGTSFRDVSSELPSDDKKRIQALRALSSTNKHPDDEKILLLFFQMHYISQKYPDRKIIYSFGDDIPTYIGKLYSVFKAHPELIPHNITLQLFVHNPYRLEKVTPMESLRSRMASDDRKDEIKEEVENTIVLPPIASGQPRPGYNPFWLEVLQNYGITPMENTEVTLLRNLQEALALEALKEHVKNSEALKPKPAKRGLFSSTKAVTIDSEKKYIDAAHSDLKNMIEILQDPTMLPSEKANKLSELALAALAKDAVWNKYFDKDKAPTTPAEIYKIVCDKDSKFTFPPHIHAYARFCCVADISLHESTPALQAELRKAAEARHRPAPVEAPAMRQS